MRYAALAVVVSACAAPKKPPVPFVKTPAFKAIEGKAMGVLDQDVNGDGLPDVVVAQREGPGFVPVVYVQLSKNETTEWQEGCRGPLVRGDDLDAFRFGEFGGAKVLYMVALFEEPEVLVQDVAIFDTTCQTHLQSKVTLPKVDAVYVATPTDVRGGAQLLDNGTLRIVDQPRYLALVGTEGPVKVLTGVRQRVFATGEVDEQQMDLVQPVLLQAQLVRTALPPESSALEGGDPTLKAGPEQALPKPDPLGQVDELVDRNDATGVTFQPEESAVVRLQAQPTMRLVEIHHGCGDEAVTLVVTDTAGQSVKSGHAPPAQSFVLGVGKASGTGKARRELFLLSQPTSELQLSLGPTEAPRCVREFVGYTLALPAPTQASDGETSNESQPHP